VAQVTQVDPARAAVIGHGPKILFEDLQIDDHARCREVFFVQVFEIAARDARFNFVVAIRAAGGKRRGGCRDAASGGSTQKTSAGSHMEHLIAIGQALACCSMHFGLRLS